MSGGSCCVGCHFGWEERNVFPLLKSKAPELLARLQIEHQEMREHKRRTGRWPKARVVQHAAFEDQIFSMVLGAELGAELHRQHEELERRDLEPTDKCGRCGCGA